MQDGLHNLQDSMQMKMWGPSYKRQGKVPETSQTWGVEEAEEAPRQAGLRKHALGELGCPRMSTEPNRHPKALPCHLGHTWAYQVPLLPAARPI